MSRKIKILIVDDSAFMRRAITTMINSDPALEVVGIGKNGKECIEQVELLKPDIVTLDIEMPVMNGLEALRIIMEKNPVPVLMLSSLTEEGAKATLDALDIGAVDFIPKNLENLSVKIIEIQAELIKKIKLIARTRSFFIPSVSVKRTSSPLPVSDVKRTRGKRIEIVAIGSSTGGPKAVKELLAEFPETLPAAIVIVQHMPALFLTQFAKRLNQVCKLDVAEAKNGEKVEPGKVVVAPGGLHTIVARKTSTYVEFKLLKEPSGVYHIPAVDVMMSSVAKAYSSNAMGVILTGMGNDGTEGMKDIKENRGITVAQDKDSCVVYGMPKSVVDAGLADFVMPLSSIAHHIQKMIL